MGTSLVACPRRGRSIRSPPTRDLLRLRIHRYMYEVHIYVRSRHADAVRQSGYVWAPIKRGCAVLVCPHPPSFLLPPPGSGHRAFLWSRLMPCLIRHPHAPFLRPSPSTWVFVYNIHAPTGQAPLSGQASRDLGRRCIHGWVFGSAAPWMGDGASFRQPPASGRQA